MLNIIIMDAFDTSEFGYKNTWAALGDTLIVASTFLFEPFIKLSTQSPHLSSSTAACRAH